MSIWCEVGRRGKSYPLRLGLLDGVDEAAELIAHGLGSNTGGSSLEVDVTGAANASIERVALGHQRVHASYD